MIKPIGAETIIPGQGPVCGPDIIDATLEYLHFVQATARGGRSVGRTPLEAAREARLGSYAELTDAERIVGNLHRAYAELDGAPRELPSTPPPHSMTWSHLTAACRWLVTLNTRKSNSSRPCLALCRYPAGGARDGLWARARSPDVPPSGRLRLGTDAQARPGLKSISR